MTFKQDLIKVLNKKKKSKYNSKQFREDGINELLFLTNTFGGYLLVKNMMGGKIGTK